jgi:hypothetical protein
MPPGTIHIDGTNTEGEAIRLGAEHADVTIRGADPADGETRLVLAPGHQTVHSAIYIRTDPGESVGTVRLERLTIDGNKSEQGPNPGLGVRTEAEGEFVMRDCVVTGWQNTGVQLNGGMRGDIRYCHFYDNGLRSNGGHDISPNQARHPAETVISHVLCENSGGVSIDVGQNDDARLQTVLVERCVLRNSPGSLKISTENKLTTVRNTQMLGDDSTTIPVKVNPTDVTIDDLVLDNVLIDGGGWPGIDLPCPGRLQLNEVALKNIDQDNESRGRDRGGIFTRKIDFGSSGRVSIHNVGQDNNSIALNVEEAAGSIDELVYNDVGDFGTADGVEVKNRVRGDPLQPDVVSVDDVGPR